MVARSFWRRPVVRVGLAALAALVVVLLLARPKDPASQPRYSDERMRAVVYESYGTTEVLRVEQMRRPLPGEGQVLVEVIAVAVNPLDWHTMRGTPYVMRLSTGLLEPKEPRLGVDVAGRVVAVGPKVMRFAPGDEVFGAARGAFAEFALASEHKLAHKPANVSFAQAAGIGIAASTALQGLRDAGRVHAGDRVLINGASGGVGTFAVQIAKAMGADVTGVCSGRNAAMVTSLGADRVIDYTKQDFTLGSQRYDVVLDLVGNRALLDVRRVLEPDGRHVLIGGGGPEDGRLLGPLDKALQGWVLSRFVGQEFVTMLASIEQADLEQLAELMQSGKVVPVVDRTYGSLDEIRDAIAYLERGRARGKVIVEVAGVKPAA